MSVELNIINAMLASVGVSAFSSENSTHPYYVEAKKKLDEVSEDIQARGWWFNETTEQITLTPSPSGEIVLPADTLSFIPDDSDTGITRRGSRLYDKNNRTYAINRPVKGRLVDLVRVDEVPTKARNYIQALAVLEFHIQKRGAQTQEYAAKARATYDALFKEDLSHKRLRYAGGRTPVRFVRPGSR